MFGEEFEAVASQLAHGRVHSLCICEYLWAYGPNNSIRLRILRALNEHHLQGERLAILFKSVCTNSYLMVSVVALALELGHVSASQVDAAMEGSAKLDLETLLKRVRLAVPKFGLATQ